MVDIAGILVPGEGAVFVGTFDDVLVPEEVNFIAKGGTANLRHEIAEDETAYGGLFLVRIVG
jgi:hypothetical protein